MQDAPSPTPCTGASDIRAVTTAMTQLIENLLRSMVQETVPDLVKLQVEQSLKSLLPELVQRAIAQEQDLITESAQSIAREMLPGLLDRIATPLIESEARRLFEESAQQSVQSVAREMLPGLLNQIGPPLIENEVRRLMAESAQTIIEKVVWDVVPSQAELEVKKEISRLQAEP